MIVVSTTKETVGDGNTNDEKVKKLPRPSEDRVVDEVWSLGGEERKKRNEDYD